MMYSKTQCNNDTCVMLSFIILLLYLFLYLAFVLGLVYLLISHDWISVMAATDQGGRGNNKDVKLII